MIKRTIITTEEEYTPPASAAGAIEGCLTVVIFIALTIFFLFFA